MTTSPESVAPFERGPLGDARWDFVPAEVTDDAEQRAIHEARSAAVKGLLEEPLPDSELDTVANEDRTQFSFVNKIDGVVADHMISGEDTPQYIERYLASDAQISAFTELIGELRAMPDGVPAKSLREVINELPDLPREERAQRRTALKALSFAMREYAVRDESGDGLRSWDELSEEERSIVRAAELVRVHVTTSLLEERLNNDTPLSERGVQTVQKTQELIGEFLTTDDIPEEDRSALKAVVFRAQERLAELEPELDLGPSDLDLEPDELELEPDESEEDTVLAEPEPAEEDTLSSRADETVVATSEPEPVEEEKEYTEFVLTPLDEYKPESLSSSEEEEVAEPFSESPLEAAVKESEVSEKVVAPQPWADYESVSESGAELFERWRDDHELRGVPIEMLLQDVGVQPDTKRERTRQRYLSILRNEIGYGESLREGGILNSFSILTERLYAYANIFGGRRRLQQAREDVRASLAEAIRDERVPEVQDFLLSLSRRLEAMTHREERARQKPITTRIWETIQRGFR